MEVLNKNQRRIDHSSVNKTGSTQTIVIHYFFGSNIAREVTVWFCTMPPRTIGPGGVDKVPRLSMRASAVSSSTVSHRFPCTSNSNVIVDTSAGFPSYPMPL